MPLRVLHLNTYEHGGAGRAARAIHEVLRASGVESTFVTSEGLGRTDRARFVAARAADRALLKLQRSPRHPWRSTARFSTITARQINESNADVVNLHWITDGFLSIEEIGKITKPLVWSMYDIWPFAGTEHYEAAPDAHRPQQGYTAQNRPKDESGFDLDRWTWQRKRDHWRPITMVAASTWLEEQTKSSALMSNWPIARIPHIVNTEELYPVDMWEARRRLGIDHKGPLVGFLSTGGTSDKRKGWDLLEQAMATVRMQVPEAKVLVVGPHASQSTNAGRDDLILLGSVQGSDALRDVYGSVNVVAVPSREDNMPLTAMEAQSCGRGVVGFRVGGLPSIVQHQRSGFLAQPFHVDELCEGIGIGVEDSLKHNQWRECARRCAELAWAPVEIFRQYRALYERTLA